jgi:hypothetical protein
MKLFILVDEMKYECGVYGYKPIELEEVEKPIKEKLSSASQIAKSALGLTSSALTVSTALRVGTSVLGSLTPIGLGISGALLAGTAIKGTYDIFCKNPDAKTGEWGMHQSLKNIESDFSGYLNSSIIIEPNTISGKYKDAYNRPELYGAFAGHKQMQKVLESDGANSEIIIMPTEVAHKHFEHSGNGVFAPGKYAPHPKKLNVLIPFDSYHHHLLMELGEEFKRLFSCLGAKKILIYSLEGVSIDGTGTVPTKGKAKVEYEKTEERKKTYEFFPEQMEFESALKDKVWVQDYPQMFTFLETRKSYKLKKFEETVKVNTSFDVDVNVMRQFNSGFRWEKESKYKYVVEFYSKQELDIAA